jgi:hypothetical protein
MTLASPEEVKSFIDGWLREHLAQTGQMLSVIELVEQLRTDAATAGISSSRLEHVLGTGVEELVMTAVYEHERSNQMPEELEGS